MAPAAWWATYGSHTCRSLLTWRAACPRAGARAASVVSCASAAERNWSVYGKIKTEQRSRLGHAVADKLVYAHEALHLREKLQSASYVQTVEKWDTDSDSNESDDEEDLKR